jgi:hypothetical protein
MGGKERAGGFLKVSPTVSEDGERELRGAVRRGLAALCGLINHAPTGQPYCGSSDSAIFLRAFT